MNKVKIGFGVPWCALGRPSLFSDSGFLLVYEMLKQQYEKHGVISLIVIDKQFQPTFEGTNNPEVTGVWPLYNEESRALPRSFDGPISNEILNGYMSTAKICPVDYVFTNKRHIAGSYALQAFDRWDRYRVPTYLHPTTAGKEGSTAKVPKTFENHLRAEAASYMMVYRVLWPTTEQRSRGLAIARRFLSSTEVKRIKDMHRIVGGGITELIRPYAISDKQVCNQLQNPQKDFRVSFVGRTNSVKNFSYIIDTLRTMFIRHSISLEVVSIGEIEMPSAYKKCSNAKDAQAVIGHHETGGSKGRDYYAGKILPSLQCGISATITECHPSIPREAGYVGVPWLIPSNRPWGPALFGQDYPFMYGSEAECIALVQRIRKGKITDAECKAFNAIRRDKKKMGFMGDTASEIYDLACEDMSNYLDFTAPHNLSRLIDGWERWVKIGDTFEWRKLPSAMQRLKAGTIADRPQQRTPYDMWTKIRDRVECVDPVAGLFRRLD
jgi:hypothetical protein